MSLEYVAGGAFVLLLISVSLWAYDEAVNPKNRIESTGEGFRFPQLHGVTLSGKVLILPAGIEGEIALLLLLFHQHQQPEIETWIALARRLADRYEGFTFYELQTIERMPAVARAMITTRLRTEKNDPSARDSTLTLYLDKDSFHQALGIWSEDKISALLINSEGEILWRTEGPASAVGKKALYKALSEKLKKY